MTFHLRFEPHGETIDVAQGQTVLDACLRAGLYIPHACGHGRCGTCKIDILEGDLDMGDASPFALMDVEREEGKALACVATLNSDAAIEAPVDDEPDAVRHVVRDFDTEIVARVMITPDFVSLTLAIPGELLFQAGQYVNVQVPGVTRPRAFSIASSPHRPEKIDLHIKLVPGGEATSILHRASIGDRLRITGPFGRFFVRRSAQKPIILVAGGSGLSAIRSMLLALDAERPEQDVYLFHGARTEADLCFAREHRELAARWPGMRFIPALSQGDGATGHIHEVMEQTFEGRFAGHTAYLCGPPPMIEACIRSLMKGRLFERDIYIEKFITQADDAQASRSPLFKRL